MKYLALYFNTFFPSFVAFIMPSYKRKFSVSKLSISLGITESWNFVFIYNFEMNPENYLSTFNQLTRDNCEIIISLKFLKSQIMSIHALDYTVGEFGLNDLVIHSTKSISHDRVEKHYLSFCFWMIPSFTWNPLSQRKIENDW